MKLSFQETVRTCSIARLIREGYLSPFRSYLVPNYTVDEVADFYLADVERWGKSLVYFSTIAECVAFKARLAKGGVGCEVVTGESDKDVQMAAFANGAVQVIANVAMLTEGFDQPDVMSIFARDASRLPTISLKHLHVRKSSMPFVLAGLLLLVAFLVSNFWLTLGVLGAGYILTVPVSGLMFLRTRARMERASPLDADAAKE